MHDIEVQERVFLSLNNDNGRVTRYCWSQGENMDFATSDWSWAWAGNAYGDG